MPNTELSEILFILIMFVVVIIISVVTLFLFVKQFKKEKRDAETGKPINAETEERGDAETQGEEQ
jgi:heme/copper-type cytochrome/quinol oxidase subunit 2